MKRTRRIIPLVGLVSSVALSMMAVGLFNPTVVPARADSAVGLATLVSIDGGARPSVSGDGRYVVFEASPPTIDGRTTTVWLRDQQTDLLLEVTSPLEGIRLGDSVMPTISNDGCVVVVTSQMAYDLFRDDDRGTRWDVYRATMPACGGTLGDWELVSSIAGYDGQAAALGEADPTQQIAISSKGTVVAYVRPFRPLSGLPDPDHNQTSIEVVDFAVPIDQIGRTTTAAGMPASSPDDPALYVGQAQPGLSGDGQYLVFSSDATSQEAVAQWSTPTAPGVPAIRQVFIWDRTNIDPFTNVSLVSQGAQGGSNADAGSPSVSSDGRYVAFASGASNLVAAEGLTVCADNCPTQVYRFDRDLDNNFVFDEPGAIGIELVSGVDAPLPADGSELLRAAGNGASFSPSLSGDGNTVAFSTQARNLMTSQVPGLGELGDGDILIADLDLGVVRRVFARPDLLPGAHAHPQLSANGRVLVVDSLVAGALVNQSEVAGRQIVSTMFVPRVSLAPLNVGTVTVAVPGQEWFVNVLNDGPGSFTPAVVQADNPDFAITGGSCFDQVAVHSGGFCDVKVMLTPSVAGPVAATLTVAETGYGALTLTAALSGIGGEPALEAQPAGADLGSARVGTAAGRQSLTITNVSLGPTTVAGVELTGVHPTDFAVVANTCGVGLALGSSCTIDIEFTPSNAGRRSATAVISTESGQTTAVLLGGEGRYEAVLLAQDRVKSGSRIDVGGLGFPANTSVTVGFSNGRGRSVTVTTDDNGGFLTELVITNGQRAAQYTLLAQAADGTTASSALKVVKSAPNLSAAAG